MTNKDENVVYLSNDLVAKCKDYTAKIVVHYRSGDVLQAMPWTRDQMTEEQCQQWLASRKEVAHMIDIETCELGSWYAYDLDPYGMQNDLNEEEQQIGKNRFVRSPDSNGWVHESDLSHVKYSAMYKRIRREAAAREAQ